MKNSGLRINVFLVALILIPNHIFAQNVIPLVPKDGEELTDIAVAFKVQVTTDGPYQLQVSKNSNFTAEVLTQETSVKHLYNHVYFFSREGLNIPAEKFLLTPGTWFWRVSDDDEVSWSATRSLIVNDDHSPTPQPWEISSKKPLFHWRLRSLIIENPATAAAQLKKMVPDAIKDYVVLDLGQSFLYHMTKGRDLLEYSRFFNDLGYKFTFDVGAFSHKDRVGSLAELEQVFKELPNCVGAATSEQFYGYFFYETQRSQHDGTLELCRKYGKMYVYADMNHVRPKWIMHNYLNWDKFKNENYGDYLVPLYKNTDPWGAYTCVSALQGMKLTGMVKNIGIWSDEWCWEKFGNPGEFNLENWSQNGHHGDGAQLTYPFMQHIKQYIWGITYGSNVFALEGNLQWDYHTGEPNDNHSRYLAPFVDAVISEHIIPSQEAINENFHVIVNTENIEKTETKILTYQDGNIWGDFLRSTYGIRNTEIYNSSIQTDRGPIRQSAYLEMTPNTDRYPTGIPFLPKIGVDSPVVNGRTLEVVKISDLNTTQKVNENLNAYYPESDNQAYARRIDSSIFVFNTLENEDIRQDYKVDIQFAGINQLYGNIDLMSYVIGKCRPDGKTLFIQANAYVANPGLKGGRYTLPSYPSILNFKCNEKPVLASNEMSAIVKQEWDNTTKVFTVEVNHASAGAVNFTLTGDSLVSYLADSVVIAKQYIDILVHETAIVEGSVYPDTLQGVPIVWKSLNPGVASISPQGLITGNGDGVCKIVAQANNTFDTLEINVTEIKATKLKLSSKELFLNIGDTVNLTVSVYPENVSFPDVSWMAKRLSIANVNNTGEVVAYKDGETFVVVTNIESGLTDTCYIYIGEQTILNKNISDKIKLYPNPANDILYIKGVEDKSTFTIFSLSGTIISHSKKLPLNLQGLKQGTYILKIESEDQVVFKKFLKG